MDGEQARAALLAHFTANGIRGASIITYTADAEDAADDPKCVEGRVYFDIAYAHKGKPLCLPTGFVVDGCRRWPGEHEYHVQAYLKEAKAA